MVGQGGNLELKAGATASGRQPEKFPTASTDVFRGHPSGLHAPRDRDLRWLQDEMH